MSKVDSSGAGSDQGKEILLDAVARPENSLYFRYSLPARTPAAQTPPAWERTRVDALTIFFPPLLRVQAPRVSRLLLWQRPEMTETSGGDQSDAAREGGACRGSSRGRQCGRQPCCLPRGGLDGCDPDVI